MRIREVAPRFIFHTFLAIVGVTAIWFIMMGPGLALGFLVNRNVRDQSACWAWPIGIAWLGYGIWDECREYRFPPWHPANGDFLHRAWHMFFTNFRDSGAWGGSALGLLIFTMPALGSVAYSLGAWLALRSKPIEA